jgi:dsRNA-specific ribonuclease
VSYRKNGKTKQNISYDINNENLFIKALTEKSYTNGGFNDNLVLAHFGDLFLKLTLMINFYNETALLK